MVIYLKEESSYIILAKQKYLDFDLSKNTYVSVVYGQKKKIINLYPCHYTTKTAESCLKDQWLLLGHVFLKLKWF